MLRARDKRVFRVDLTSVFGQKGQEIGKKLGFGLD
jgi:hypothetical protein